VLFNQLGNVKLFSQSRFQPREDLTTLRLGGGRVAVLMACSC